MSDEPERWPADLPCPAFVDERPCATTDGGARPTCAMFVCSTCKRRLPACVGEGALCDECWVKAERCDDWNDEPV